ncbi:2Fe-2S iron-sulfur cluster binding domain-containing protein [Occultella glacieicola]|uniref:2Fe-2S iron-sulfur cluster binding domain-containing protein n=1 Tax=Occultella glacieicola TaxID=2518684 RepID=A0ABY2E6W7_9MICO|nr:FAD binding domain-containing protein [Occultella glacieicola]TDE95023.1 2Fe-2S iron-sulfur cluster binding domain-containing protein [Occultella glacieicola]
MDPIQVTVNGEVRTAGAAGPHTNLLDWLRGEGFTGAKEGCAEGECGACAVLVARPEPDGTTRWVSVNSCLPPALAFDGQEVVTSEGLGRAPGACAVADLHPVQKEMAERGGSQCGYCTPGFVCSMAAEYYRPDRTPVEGDGDAQTGPAAVGDDHNTHAADHEHGPNGFDLHAMSGNLCRCTGYRPIKDAAYALGRPDDSDALARRRTAPAPAARPTRLRTDTGEFVRPASLAELLERLAADPDAVLVAGATDAGVERNIAHRRPPLVLAIDRLEELRGLEIDDDHIELGAALTLTEIETRLAGRIPLLADLFPQFASRLIRNGATLGGNLGTGSPIGDAPPVLLALDASVLLASAAGERDVPLAEYFTGYRESVRTPGEIIRSVRIPLPLAPHAAFYKIAKRRFDDISSVAVAIAAVVEQRTDGGSLTRVRIGLGGVAATPIRARATEDALAGRPWTADVAREAAAIMATEGTPLDDHRASARYRASMLEQALLKFYEENHASPALEVTR